ncbi:metallophosphoesterase family protein [Paenalkalicoccus suaedae]|uniref:metallophosphoesterase family protein n=1 Tax=Paenalkalicoccus suaedae TaxID=2592382 RepID=UPI001588ACE2|nr:DNA repair exonuclease [Paenalkalicoccus suaedae]
MSTIVTFIHCADIHLGRSGANVGYEATEKSFMRICEEAVRRDVEFIIIAGDVYDQEKRSLKSQWFFSTCMQILLDANIQAYVVHGNHDPTIGEDKLVSFPQNVHVFSTEGEGMIHRTSRGEEVALYGFSYPTRAYTENPLPMYQKTLEADYHIGVLHGQEATNTDHEPYAPFFVRELVDLRLDYVALGHIHVRQVLQHDPPIVYSGNVQGTNRKEAGEKGCYAVTLHPGGHELEFVATHEVLYQTEHVSIDSMQDVDDIVNLLRKRLDESKPTNLTLQFSGRGALHRFLLEESNREELKELLEQEFQIQIEKIMVHTKNVLDFQIESFHDHVASDIVQARRKLEHEHALFEAIRRKKLTSIVEPMLEEERAAILYEAEQLLLQQVLEESE